HQIPPDLVIEILSRLPTISLKRFQCVSKEWLSIIQSQVFIDSFSSLSRTRSLFLVAVRSAENRVALLSSSHNETEKPTTFKMPTPGLLHPSDPGRFTICNPSTRQIITLPDLKASRVTREDRYMFLGYDPVGNEYKALCSTVLTLGGGNLIWRNIKGRKTERYNVVTNGICINVMVYFGGWTTRRQEKEPRVFHFDVRGEKMGYIRTFWAFITRGSLINYNGKLAAVYPIPREPLHGFDIWVLDDFDKSSPSLVGVGKTDLKILGVNKHGEIILGPMKLPRKHEPLFMRRVKLENFEELGCNHTGDEKCVCQLFFSPEYFESLLSL
ncbi:hypothetical protein EUTSA_v10001134mg, partial [Eutrema salsugineum]